MELNNIGTYIGRLTKDIEIKNSTPDDNTKAVGRISLAVDREWMGKKKKEEAESKNMPTSDFPFGLVAFGENVVRWAKWFKKGDLIHVSYLTRTRKYNPEDGEPRMVEDKVIEKISLRKRSKANEDAWRNSQNTASGQGNKTAPSSDGFKPMSNNQFDDDDDLPF